MATFRSDGGAAAVRLKVAMMSDEAARRRLAALVADPLEANWNADEVDLLAERLGVTVKWQHLDLSDPDAGWKEGRHGTAD